MRHIHLTCKNHPELRWQCKSVAYTEGYGYNGARSIFFNGRHLGGHAYNCDTNVRECDCPPTDLILAPGETGDKDETVAA